MNTAVMLVMSIVAVHNGAIDYTVVKAENTSWEHCREVAFASNSVNYLQAGNFTIVCEPNIHVKGMVHINDASR